MMNSYCDRTCAIAAPLTPKLQVKMRIGSNIMFATSPATKEEKENLLEN